MRLSTEYVHAIKQAAAEVFGPRAVVRLFGSRIDDARRGGDIDLHIEVDEINNQWQQRGLFEDRLFEMIEPQKVDVVLTTRGVSPRAFERIAYRDGIVL